MNYRMICTTAALAASAFAVSVAAQEVDESQPGPNPTAELNLSASGLAAPPARAILVFSAAEADGHLCSEIATCHSMIK
jgi:hypothetical protein